MGRSSRKRQHNRMKRAMALAGSHGRRNEFVNTLFESWCQEAERRIRFLVDGLPDGIIWDIETLRRPTGDLIEKARAFRLDGELYDAITRLLERHLTNPLKGRIIRKKDNGVALAC